MKKSMLKSKLCLLVLLAFFFLILPVNSPFQILHKLHGYKCGRSQWNYHCPVGKREGNSPESRLHNRHVNCCKLQEYSAQYGIDKGPVSKDSQGEYRIPLRTPVKGVEHQGNNHQGKDQSLDFWKRNSIIERLVKDPDRLDCNQSS